MDEDVLLTLMDCPENNVTWAHKPKVSWKSMEYGFPFTCKYCNGPIREHDRYWIIDDFTITENPYD